MIVINAKGGRAEQYWLQTCIIGNITQGSHVLSEDYDLWDGKVTLGSKI
jgi:hypothetical protein